MTGRKAEPPQGSRKVPGFKVWMTEDGIPYGPHGRIATRNNRGCMNAEAPKDGGGRTTRGVAKMMQETWMPPKPEGAHVIHLDGNTENNAASNLAWADRKPNSAYSDAWRRKKIAAMSADPKHPAHGTRLGYDAGCRCRICKNASKLAHRAYKTRKTIEKVMDVCRTTEQ